MGFFTAWDVQGRPNKVHPKTRWYPTWKEQGEGRGTVTWHCQGKAFASPISLVQPVGYVWYQGKTSEWSGKWAGGGWRMGLVWGGREEGGG